MKAIVSKSDLLKHGKMLTAVRPDKRVKETFFTLVVSENLFVDLYLISP